MGIEATVLNNWSVSNRIVDLRLDIFIKVNSLSIAAAFDIENSLITPACLIISYNFSWLRT